MSRLSHINRSGYVSLLYEKPANDLQVRSNAAIEYLFKTAPYSRHYYEYWGYLNDLLAMKRSSAWKGTEPDQMPKLILAMFAQAHKAETYLLEPLVRLPPSRIVVHEYLLRSMLPPQTPLQAWLQAYYLGLNDVGVPTSHVLRYLPEAEVRVMVRVMMRQAQVLRTLTPHANALFIRCVDRGYPTLLGAYSPSRLSFLTEEYVAWLLTQSDLTIQAELASSVQIMAVHIKHYLGYDHNLTVDYETWLTSMIRRCTDRIPHTVFKPLFNNTYYNSHTAILGLGLYLRSRSDGQTG